MTRQPHNPVLSGTYDDRETVLTDLLTALGQKSPDLASVIRAWLALPDAIRVGIIAMVDAAQEGER